MKKIMFNDKYGLTKAVLEGRKTMTRRIIQDKDHLYEDIRRMKFSHLNDYGNAVMRSATGFAELRPHYRIGEVVAVAQAYKDTCWTSPVLRLKDEPGWSNKKFVYAGLMPHQIRITNVRVEWLQDISDEDCIKEGIIEDAPRLQYSFPTNIGYCGQYPFNTPRDAFAVLIDRISGKGTFESNPWVFVYEFELVK